MINKSPQIPLEAILDVDYFRESNVLNLLPAAVYACDLSGQIVMYNQKAVELWGRTPRKGDKDDRFCGAFKLYYPNGEYLPHCDTPVAACLKDGLARKDIEVVIERPDLSQIIVNVNIAPIRNERGELVGAVNCFNDITEQKRVHKELDWKKKELQDYIDNASIALHWVDEHGTVIWANNAELDMLGYTADEYIGHHISEFHADQDKINDILRRLSGNETLNAYESVLRCKDGSTRTVHISSSVFREEGKFVHTRCFTIDVTEQKQLYQQIATSEKRYRQLIQRLNTPLYTTDAEGRITLYNKAAVALWGREPEIGKDLWCGSYKILKTDGTALPLDSCPMAICLKEKREVSGEEIVVVRPDGTLRNVAPHPQPVFDNTGKLTGAINMLVDITAIKQAEKKALESEQNYRDLAASLEKTVKEKTRDLIEKNEELRKSEERYHSMVEEVEDYAIIFMDRNGNIQNWNRGAEKIKGYKSEEVIGKNFEIFYLPEDRRAGVPQKLIKEAAAKGKATIEGWRLRKDGSRFWGSIVITALHDNQGNIMGFTKVTRDLTERKIADDKLKSYSRELEFQNKELEQFTYAASHDMKEPLRKIHLYNTYIRENKFNKLNQRSLDYLGRSIRSVSRMNNLIEDLLTYSRTTSNADVFKEVDFNAITTDIITELKDELQQKGIVVESGQLPVINGIPFQCRQLMYNLINNAIKYTPPGRKGLIKISSRYINAHEREELKTTGINRYHQISVQDNGIGFEQEYAAKIFEIFQRLGTLPDVKGSGIGLALCKKIVQNHNGYISAAGKVNEGARFDIYLPEST